ncbi:MAG: hypothetical protein LW731_12720 [Oxalobacteraceae bacterium]|nr:hypothetical protein [Oxalobacteraceae bacterium]
MNINYPSDAELLRAEIAAAAARMIAEDGADYGTAKRKAARLILGNQRVRGDVLPDNAQIEAEVRDYQALFQGDEQSARLLHLRRLALEVMERFQAFAPYLTGAVLNGTASEHSDIHLQLFAESSKDVAVFLLNADMDYEVSETPHFRRPDRSVETLSFFWKHEVVHLTIYDPDDLRGGARTSSGKRIERADIAALKILLTEKERDD